ncbi:thiol reductant ABC exporter subunit CydC [Actinoplanes sp. CA-252034]|uniref:thiol reductant ABC exporter subunit CydC n=1 Tax=Actinoplanes sp. CA-252034 TaxID=3239906 RepID=UPI003D9577ED
MTAGPPPRPAVSAPPVNPSAHPSAVPAAVGGTAVGGPAGVAGRRASRGPVDPRLLRHARASRSGIILLAVIGVGQALATIAIAVALCGIVTALTTGSAGVLAGTPAQALDDLLPATTGWAIVLLAIAFTVRGALAWAEQVVAQRTAARVTDELRRSLLDRVVRRGPAWVAAHGSGRLTAVLGTGLDALRPWFSGYLPALLLGVVLPPLVVVIMAVVDPASAVVALLTIPLLPLLGALIGWATKARAEQRWAADSRLAGHFLDVVRGLPTLKMYGRADRQIDVIADLTDRHRAATMRVLRVAFLSSTALDLVGTLAVGLIAVQTGLRVAAGSMELGPALLVILLAPEAYRPLREMAARYHASTDAEAVIADVDEILSADSPTVGPFPSHVAERPSVLPPGTPGPDGPVTAQLPVPPSGSRGPDGPVAARSPVLPAGSPGPDGPVAAGSGVHGLRRVEPLRESSRPPAAFGDSPRRITAVLPVFGRAASGRWGVRVSGLRARYPGASDDALDLPELTVRAGEIVALRGVSGAGKTTALRVLAGLHPAESGAIAVGNTFYLPQRPSLPHARTVAEAFPPDATTAEIRRALHVAGLNDEVADRTPLGEQAAGISAGQRQRLALAVLLHRAARAVAGHRYRDAPAVVTLLLDEPTAHLDSTAEHLVIARLHEFAAQGCAVLVVAHRPALLAAADHIVDVHPPAGAALTPGTVTASVAGPLESPSWAALAPDDITTSPHADPPGGADAATETGLPGTPEQREHSPRSTPDPDDATTTPHGGPLDRHADGTRAAAEGRPQSSREGLEDPERAREAGGRRWGRLWVAALLGAGSSLAGIVLTGAAAWLLVRASSLPPVLSLSTGVVLVRGSAVARPLLRYLERLVSHEVAFARLGRRRAAVYADLIPHVPGPRMQRRGDLLTRLVDDVDATTDGLLRGRLPMIAAAVTGGLGVVVVAGVAAPAAIPVAVGLLVAGVVAPAIAARLLDRQEAATGTARAALRDAVVETVDGVEDLAAGGGRPDVPRDRSRTLAHLEARTARESGLAAAVAHIGWGAAAVGVAVVLARGGLTAEWSAVVLLGVIVLGEAIVLLPEAAIARRRAAAAERRVAELTGDMYVHVDDPHVNTNGAVNASINIDESVNQPADAVDGVDAWTGGRAGRTGETARDDAETSTCEQAGRGRGAVRVDGLVAGWRPTEPPILDGLGLSLPAGSRTAIMGRSGCGKSTLAAVLAGLLSPRAGNVEVSGTAVLVGDETGHVFASTVRENLRLASPAATDPRMRAVLARVGLGWMELDSWLGAAGGTISGGQRRRLATARALLADPALLILDEPTEGIDEAGARELMADLLDAASGRTVLVLAHRTDGLDLVDRILELTTNGLEEKNVGLDRSVL